MGPRARPVTAAVWSGLAPCRNVDTLRLAMLSRWYLLLQLVGCLRLIDLISVASSPFQRLVQRQRYRPD